MAQEILLKARGLYTNAGPITTPDGSLAFADNIIIDKEWTIRSRRGLYKDGSVQDFQTGGGYKIYARSLGYYSGHILAHTLTDPTSGTSPNTWDVYEEFSGAWKRVRYNNVFGVTPPIRPVDPNIARAKFVEAVKNLYITSSAGILKMDSEIGVGTNASGAINPIAELAGVAKADDVLAKILVTSGGVGTYGKGFLKSDTAVAYRLVWGIKDANGNLIIGPPSGRYVVRNKVLDGAVAKAGGGTETFTVTSPNVYNSQTDDGTLLAAGGLLTGDRVEVRNSVGADTDANKTTANPVTINSGNGSTTVGWAEAGTASGSGYKLYFGTRPVRVFMNNQPNFDSRCFCRLYRSKLSATGDTEPSDEMFLAYDGLSPNNAGSAYSGLSRYIDDYTPDFLLGEALYTNPSQEGIVQSNDRPPLSVDMAQFKSCMFYANTRQPHRLQFQILSVLGDTGIQNGDQIRVGELTFTATTGTPGANQFKLFNYSFYDQQQNLRESAKDLVRAINATGLSYRAFYVSGPTDPAGKILIEAKFAGWGGSGAYTSGFGVWTNATRQCYTPNIPNIATTFSITNIARSNSIATYTTAAAHGLNVGNYIQIYSATGAALNGLRQITAVPSTTTFSCVEQDATDQVSTAATATAVKLTLWSDDNYKPNGLYFSKPGQPEAVPITNYFEVGSAIYGISRIKQVNESLFIFKDDGLFRLTGDDQYSFRVDAFDPTIKLIAPESVVSLSNNIIAFTNQGVVSINETGATVISRNIEEDLMKIYASNTVQVKNKCFGISYESERLYVLSIVSSASDTENKIAYVYNFVTQTWTMWNFNNASGTMTSGFVSPANDKIYIGSTDHNSLSVEQKTRTERDFVDRTYSLTFSSLALSDTANKSYKFNMTGMSASTPIAIGDVVMLGDSVRFIVTDFNVAGNTVTIESPDGSDPSLFIAGARTFYGAIPVFFRFNVQIAGNAGSPKHFRIAQIYSGNEFFSQMKFEFSSDKYGVPRFKSVFGLSKHYWNLWPWSVNYFSKRNGAERGMKPHNIVIAREFQRATQFYLGVQFNCALEEMICVGVGLLYNEVTEGRVARG